MFPYILVLNFALNSHCHVELDICILVEELSLRQLYELPTYIDSIEIM